jgi:uncharacterized protein YaaN involved in tellurite resistance
LTTDAIIIHNSEHINKNINYIYTTILSSTINVQTAITTTSTVASSIRGQPLPNPEDPP